MLITNLLLEIRSNASDSSRERTALKSVHRKSSVFQDFYSSVELHSPM